MVYCGKPSKGCGLCRSRRIKCDELHPGCTQCKRISRPCPGYRNQIDLLFRDLSEDVRLKCINGKTTKEKHTDPILTARERKMDEVNNERWLKQPYACSNDSVALFFFNDYVLLETRKRFNMFDMLPSIYESSRPDSPLTDIITALGLVCLANTIGAPEILTSARARYVTALHNINATIRDPKVAGANETLMAVILLGLYEDNTAISGSLELWSKHIHGALVLLEIRGMQQLNSRVGRQLIMNLRTSTVSNCLLNHTSVPECITRWSALLQEHESSEEASATALASILISFCSLQECIKISKESNSTKCIVATALDHDRVLKTWAAAEYYERPYFNIETEPTSDLAFEGTFHTYHNLSMATHWNHYRTIRIMLHEIILSQLKEQRNLNDIHSHFESTTSTEDAITFSNALIVSLSKDICASVRYCLGFSVKVNNSHQPERAANAKLLLWPLYIAGKSPYVPNFISLWIAGTFDFITGVTGVRKGAGLAKALRAWPCGLNTLASPIAHWRDTVLRTDRIKYPEKV